MKKKLEDRGQGMTEYILIVALIAIAVIGAIKFFGKITDSSFRAAAGATGNAVQDSLNKGMSGQ